MKKRLNCNEYEILAKEVDSNLLILVNGEKFITIEDFSLDELDEESLIEFIFKEYERLAFAEPHVFDRFKFMTGGATCRDSKE